MNAQTSSIGRLTTTLNSPRIDSILRAAGSAGFEESLQVLQPVALLALQVRSGDRPEQLPDPSQLDLDTSHDPGPRRGRLERCAKETRPRVALVHDRAGHRVGWVPLRDDEAESCLQPKNHEPKPHGRTDRDGPGWGHTHRERSSASTRGVEWVRHECEHLLNRSVD